MPNYFTPQYLLVIDPLLRTIEQQTRQDGMSVATGGKAYSKAP